MQFSKAPIVHLSSCAATCTRTCVMHVYNSFRETEIVCADLASVVSVQLGPFWTSSHPQLAKETYLQPKSSAGNFYMKFPSRTPTVYAHDDS